MIFTFLYFCALMKRLLLYGLMFLLCFYSTVHGQKDSSMIQSAAYASDSTVTDTSSALPVNSLLSDEVSKKRQRLVGAGSIAMYGGLLYALNEAWYSKYKRSSFHFYNDNGEWNQVDKIGHTWTVYQLTGATYKAWKWAGASDKKALMLSGISGPGFLTVIEVLDGFSNKWGFSWGDMGANLLGSGLFIGQQALWNDQRIVFKFSFHQKKYTDPILEGRANNLFGNSWNERMLKDYNAQSYWLSANLKSFFPESNIPAWLNIAVGYGADGMFGGYKNEWKDEQENLISRHDVMRTRQFYLAPDIDLTRIKTKSKFLNTTFFLLNCLKFPAPALMIDNTGKLSGYLSYF